MVTSAARLYRLYSEKYPSDPVSENDFALLVIELRPAVDDENDHTSASADDESDHAATARSSVQAPVSEHGNNMDMQQEETWEDSQDRTSGPPPNFKLLEFASVWKNTGPSGAFGKHAADTVTPKRRLNVLDWGFGE